MKNGNRKKIRKLNSAWTLSNIAGKTLVYFYALLVAVPLFYALLTSFKTSNERVIDPIGFPEHLNFENYMIAWTEGGLGRAAINSIIITGGTLLLTLLNVLLVSYCLNRIRTTKIGSLFYILILSTMFIPNVSYVTSLVLRRQLGLYNNYIGEIICSSVNITTGVFIVSGFLRTIPKELEEAAMIDGAGDMSIMFRILAPVLKPALVSVGILTFTHSWNATLGPMLTLRDKNLYTVPMALLLNFTTQFSVEYEKMFAGVIITCIPIIIVYVSCQKSFISALGGSVKG